MIRLRARLSAIGLAAAMLLTVAAPLFAGELHPACVTTQHDCTKTAHVMACCCLTKGERSDTVPATGKTQIAQPTADGTLVVDTVRIARVDLTRQMHALTTAPRSSPPDLVTLFGAFLI